MHMWHLQSLWLKAFLLLNAHLRFQHSFFASVQQSGRSPGLKIIASAIFPVSQWYIGFTPWLRWRVRTGFAPVSLFTEASHEKYCLKYKMTASTPDCYLFSFFFVPVYHTAHSAIRRIAFIVTYFTGCRNGSSRILPKILLTSFLHILVQWNNSLRSLPQYRQMYPVCHSSFPPWPAGHTEWVAYTLWSDP